MGSQTFGKGSVQTVRPLAGDTGRQAHHGALLHAQRPLDPGQGHRARRAGRRNRRRQRPVRALRMREADLEHHLSNDRGRSQGCRRARRRDERQARRAGRRTARAGHAEEAAPPEFGGKDDFQLAQALNRFKGLPVKTGARPIRSTTTPAPRPSCRAPEQKPRRGQTARAATASACDRSRAAMNDDQLLRYSRHILLDEIGIEGQARVLAARVARHRRRRARLAGRAVPGRRAASAASRWSTTTTSTSPTCSARSCTRTARIGQPKVDSARAAAAADQSRRRGRRPARTRADARLLANWWPTADVVLDCSDNFATRQAVNARLRRGGVPLVAGAAIRFDGQISVFDARDADVALLRLRVPAGRAGSRTRCATMGVFAPLVGIIGAMQAAEALKLVAGIGRRWPAGCRCWTRAPWTGRRSAWRATRAAPCARSAGA